MAPTNEDPPADGQIVPKTTPEIFALSNIITVIVGEEKLTYALHESILRSPCPFFDKCLSSGMQEELEKTVRLPEERPSAFNVLVQWMYTDRITTGWTDAGLVYSYALADKFCMTGLQNAIIDHLRAQQGYTACKKRRVIMTPWLLETVWKHAEGSKLSQFVVDKLHYDVVTKPHHCTADTGGHFTERFRRLAETCPQAANALLWKFIDSRQSSTSERRKRRPAESSNTDWLCISRPQRGREVQGSSLNTTLSLLMRRRPAPLQFRVLDEGGMFLDIKDA